jgi:hypothetical protein
MAVIRDWIVPGNTVISDWWGAYSDLEEQGYSHLTVNHTIGFVDPTTGAHTNTIECQWRHLKASLHPYNRLSEYIYVMADYMFAARCRAENVDAFTLFISSRRQTGQLWLRPLLPATNDITPFHIMYSSQVRYNYSVSSSSIHTSSSARITSCAERDIDAVSGGDPLLFLP